MKLFSKDDDPGDPLADDRPVTHLPDLATRAHPVSPEDSGVHAIDEMPTVQVTCPHCKGVGYTMRTVSELLRETVDMVPDGDAVIRDFYGTLLNAHPHLAALFPGDLLSGDHAGQREKLFGALVALSKLYDPADEEGMARLETALRSFGRSHALFERPDGTARGATLIEYAAVETALLWTFAQGLGSRFTDAHRDAWTEAYDHAASIMLDEQRRRRPVLARRRRESAAEPLRDNAS